MPVVEYCQLSLRGLNLVLTAGYNVDINTLDQLLLGDYNKVGKAGTNFIFFAIFGYMKY